MKRHILVPLVVAFGVGIIALGGPKFWEKKDFSDWSKKEIKQMLTKSPWARSVTIRLGGLQPSGPQAAGQAEARVTPREGSLRLEEAGAIIPVVPV